jgi:hypothetical protein
MDYFDTGSGIIPDTCQATTPRPGTAFSFLLFCPLENIEENTAMAHKRIDRFAPVTSPADLLRTLELVIRDQLDDVYPTGVGDTALSLVLELDSADDDCPGTVEIRIIDKSMLASEN